MLTSQNLGFPIELLERARIELAALVPALGPRDKSLHLMDFSRLKVIFFKGGFFTTDLRLLLVYVSSKKRF